MSRRRRGDEDLGSMELLLDTVCNAFGGIVFMALLISLLTTDEARSVIDTEGIAAAKLGRLESTDLMSRATARRDDILARFGELASRLNTTAAELESLSALAGEVAGVDDAAIARHEAKLADITAKSAKVQGENDLLVRKIEEAQRELAAAVEETKEALPVDRRPLRMPFAHDTDRQQEAVYVSRGRAWFGVYPREQARRPLVVRLVDTADGAIGPNDLPAELASAPIRDVQAAVTAWTPLSRRIDRNSTYIAFVVWPDSHAEYLRLRDEAVKAGFGFTVFLMTADGRIGFGDSRSQEL